MTDIERKEVFEKLDVLQTSITRILGIIESDDTIKQKGLVEKVNFMSSQLNDLLTREQVYKAKATTWGTIGGIIGAVVISLIKLLITKLTNL